MYPSRDPEQASEQHRLLCVRPYRKVQIQIDFHKDLRFDSPELVTVYDLADGNERKALWLDELYSSAVHSWQTDRRICMSLRQPPTGYRYCVRWNLVSRDDKPISARWSSETDRIIQELRAPSAQSSAMQLQNLMQEVERQVRLSLGIMDDKESIEVSLMTYLVENQKPPVLTVVAANAPPDWAGWTFRITFGDGTAGRAWKLNKLQRYFRSWALPPDQKGFPYIPLSKGYHHEVLYSVPLRHLREGRLVFAVLNVGSLRKGSGLIPESSKELDFIQKIGDIAVDLVVHEIFRICGLHA